MVETMEFEQIITFINNELNEIYGSVNSVSIVIVPEEELEEILDDVTLLNSKLRRLIKKCMN